MIFTQVIASSGTVRNTAPPNVTIRMVVTTISPITPGKAGLLPRPVIPKAEEKDDEAAPREKKVKKEKPAQAAD